MKLENVDVLLFYMCSANQTTDDFNSTKLGFCVRTPDTISVFVACQISQLNGPLQAVTNDVDKNMKWKQTAKELTIEMTEIAVCSVTGQ